MQFNLGLVIPLGWLCTQMVVDVGEKPQDYVFIASLVSLLVGQVGRRNQKETGRIKPCRKKTGKKCKQKSEVFCKTGSSPLCIT